MEQLVAVSGIAAPMIRANIDTDEIIPVPEILRGYKGGYGHGLFANSRYLKDRVPNPDFILNKAPWNKSVILLADKNFGCGSSREAAPKALRGFGFRCVIAPSFSSIFYNNCFRNGLLPVELPIEQVEEIGEAVNAAKGHVDVSVDLESQTITAGEGKVYLFSVPPIMRRMLLEGLDEIELTLTLRSEIDAHFADHLVKHPWAYPT
jgi:3-isopropylmalate/(R)-2-methylmalate dehydratase small subunit